MKNLITYYGDIFEIEGTNEYKDIFNIRGLNMSPPNNYFNTSTIQKLIIETKHSVYEFERVEVKNG